MSVSWNYRSSHGENTCHCPCLSLFADSEQPLPAIGTRRWSDNIALHVYHHGDKSWNRGALAIKISAVFTFTMSFIDILIYTSFTSNTYIIKHTQMKYTQ